MKDYTDNELADYLEQQAKTLEELDSPNRDSKKLREAARRLRKLSLNQKEDDYSIARAHYGDKEGE